MLKRALSGLLLATSLSFALVGAPGAETLREGPRAVVELFTSQGCASCPPADALLTSLAARDDVVALAYHVDYWDYAGWEDTFGDQSYSDRQRAYAKGWGSSRIYTPQIVVNGALGLVGSRRNEVQDAVETSRLPLAIDIWRDGDMLKISVPANSSLSDATIWAVTYLDRADVAIETGENAGKSMVYTQVVTGRQILGMWEADTGAELALPLTEMLGTESTGLAILVQQERAGLPGLISGAAAYEL